MSRIISKIGSLLKDRRGPDRHAVWIFFTHLICLCLLFVLPEVLVSLSHPEGHDVPMELYFKAVVYVAIFYINYYVVIDRTFGRPHSVLRFAGWNLCLIFIALLILYFCWEYIGPPSRPSHAMGMEHGYHPRFDAGGVKDKAHLPAFLFRDAMVLVLSIALSVAIKITYKWLTVERKRSEEESHRKEMELRQLKTQLNPHFLFNTLNSIYALTGISPEKAQEAIHLLSKMLRYMLYDNSSTATLGSELDFVDSYVRLMRMRLPAQTDLRITLDAGGCAGMPMAPILFINLVENAFKYGMAESTSHYVEISIVASGEGVVECRTVNHRSDAHKGSGHSGGIGLSNLRKRLSLQYPGRSSLEIRDGELFEVRMTIDISTPPDITARRADIIND